MRILLMRSAKLSPFTRTKFEDNLRLVDDMAYVEDLEMPDLASFPSEQDEEVKKDLFAIVAGVMMANGSKLDSGLTAAEFDLQLQ